MSFGVLLRHIDQCRSTLSMLQYRVGDFSQDTYLKNANASEYLTLDSNHRTLATVITS